MTKQRQLYLILINLVVLAAALLAQIPTFSDPRELVRLRNAFIAKVEPAVAFDWDGPTPPADFAREVRKPPREFVESVNGILNALETDNPDEFGQALALARHMAKSPGRGGAIQTDTVRAYETIMKEGRGYCADYSQVFNGLALTAGLPVREWGMSFERYSGIGHSFNEVYDSKLRKWILVDSFYSLYFIDKFTGVPLSALEVHQALTDTHPDTRIEVEAINEKKFGFKSNQDALDYYRQGSEQMFLYYGNNVFSYDRHPVVELLSPISRAAEQGGAILIGIHPKIHLLKSDQNEGRIKELLDERIYLAGWSALVFTLLICLIFQLYYFHKTRKRKNLIQLKLSDGDSSN